MTLRIYAGWDFARIGQADLVVTDSGGTDTLSWASGSYCHMDLSGVYASSLFEDFASWVSSALNSSGTLNGSYSVSFDSDTLLYTITCDEAFVITASTNQLATEILGFYSLPTSSATSHVSDTQANYAIKGIRGGRQDDKPYEPDDIADEGEATDGLHYGFADLTPPKYRDWVIPMETLEKTRKEEVTGTELWSWEHLYEHCRNINPFLLIDGAGSHVYYLRGKHAGFNPQRVRANYDGLWHIPFRCRVRGIWSAP